MKKILVTLLAGLGIFTLVGCGSAENVELQDNNSTIEEKIENGVKEQKRIDLPESYTFEELYNEIETICDEYEERNEVIIVEGHSFGVDAIDDTTVSTSGLCVMRAEEALLKAISNLDTMNQFEDILEKEMTTVLYSQAHDFIINNSYINNEQFSSQEAYDLYKKLLGQYVNVCKAAKEEAYGTITDMIEEIKTTIENLDKVAITEDEQVSNNTIEQSKPVEKKAPVKEVKRESPELVQVIKDSEAYTWTIYDAINGRGDLNQVLDICSEMISRLESITMNDCEFEGEYQAIQNLKQAYFDLSCAVMPAVSNGLDTSEDVAISYNKVNNETLFLMNELNN